MSEQQPMYPEGDALQAQIDGRHRWGAVWRALFIFATSIGIAALLALLYNITNQAFGLAAVRTTISPQSLVIALEEEKMLSADNVVAGEDDAELAAGVAGDENSIGFFGYAFYQNAASDLRPVAVNGVAPNAQTAEDGSYPLSRPLYIYTTQSVLDENPAVAAFVNHYLENVNQEITAVGYFPASDDALTAARTAVRNAAPGALAPSEVDDRIRIAGSSTVYPLTIRLAETFETAGFGGDFSIESVGSTAGLRAFCVDGAIDIANASRPMNQAERQACREAEREPIEILVGTDALVVAVNSDNQFVGEMSLDELVTAFTRAETWADIRADWPAETIDRYIPGQESGTLDFFSEVVFNESLDTLPKNELMQILVTNISRGAGRRLEREQRFSEDTFYFETEETWAEICADADAPPGCTLPARTAENIHDIVVERVVELDVVQTWPLVESIFNREEILVENARENPEAEVQFMSWLTAEFVTDPQSSTPELAGVRTAVLGSLWVIAITIAFSFPIGVGAAIYLEEYASKTNRINRIIQTNINNLAGVPSIIYGMLGLAIFVRLLEPFTSGSATSGGGDNGRTILSAGLTLGLLILPIIIINAQEAIRAVPLSTRQASQGLGATKWQTIWHHVLPSALPGILTGTIIAVSRAIGETAPLVVVGASTFITFDPSGPFSKFTALPIQIYQWTSRPQDEFRNIAAAAIIVLLVLLLTLNATAVILRNRYARRA